VKPRIFVAETHPPDYQMHKYWSRKPANVLSSYLADLLPKNAVVVDPFCGSGVLLREASILGHSCVGMDVNPVAIALSKFTTAPELSVADYSEAAMQMLNTIRGVCESAYADSKGAEVDFAVHEVVSECRSCGHTCTQSEASGSPRSSRCPVCEASMRFNIEWMASTTVTAVKLAEKKDLVLDVGELIRQQQASEKILAGVDVVRIQQPMVGNRRTLTYEGLSTNDYFTHRNLSVLAILRKYIDAVDDEAVRAALDLTVTASMAQASRLIPFRGALSSGGPAWSVPGFWVPPVHLESNPWRHLRARVKKFERAISAIHSRPSQGSVRVQEVDAAAGMRRMASTKTRVDLVFLDPPYGDSVAFTEFSVLWNAFLGRSSPLVQDMSVSDRNESPVSWDEYAQRLHEMAVAAERLLTPDGRVLVTFNNHDERAWAALLGAVQSAGLSCERADYQIPAVVSSKAQFSPDASYLGDIYVVFRRGGQTRRLAELEPVLEERLRNCAQSRRGTISESLARRTVTLTCIEANLEAEELASAYLILDELFIREKATMVLRQMVDWDGPIAEDVFIRAAIEHLEQGPSTWKALYAAVAEASALIGVPDMKEVRDAVKDIIQQDSKSVISLANPATQVPGRQLGLFEQP